MYDHDVCDDLIVWISPYPSQYDLSSAYRLILLDASIYFNRMKICRYCDMSSHLVDPESIAIQQLAVTIYPSLLSKYDQQESLISTKNSHFWIKAIMILVNKNSIKNDTSSSEMKKYQNMVDEYAEQVLQSISESCQIVRSE